MIDDSLFPEDDSQAIYSIDFGYTNDPTALMKVVLIGNTLFIKELAYETGMAPISIRQVLYANGYTNDRPLYCEQDPEMIKLLRNIGISYAFPARKGQGSVKAGIEQLKMYDVKYTASSRNLHRDRSLYVWDKDKDTGKSLNEPCHTGSHCFDAIRYGVFTKYLRNELRRA
jgi:phage terminase large subunit